MDHITRPTSLSTTLRLHHYLTNKSSYEWDFESIMNHSESRRVFVNYMQRVEFNIEPIQFFDAIQEYHTTINSIYSMNNRNFQSLQEQFKIAAKKLFDEYLSNNCKKQVNISQELRRRIHNRMNRIQRLSEEELQGNIVTPTTPPSPETSSPSSFSGSSSGGSGSSPLLFSLRRRPSVYHNVAEVRLKELHYKFFSDVEASLVFTLKNDTFPRFIRSDLFLQFVSNCCNEKNFHLLEQLFRDEQDTRSSYTLEDIKRPNVIDSDFTMALNMCCKDANHWIIDPYSNLSADDLERYEVYVSHKPLLVPDESVMNRRVKNNSEKLQLEHDRSLMNLTYGVKLSFYLPFHYERIIPYLTCNSNEEQNKITYEKIIDIQPDNGRSNKYGHSVSRMIFQYPLLFSSNREAVYLSTARRMKIDGQEVAVIINRTVDQSNLPKSKVTNVRVAQVHLISLVKVHEGLTRFTSVMYSEPGGVLRIFSKHMIKNLVTLQIQYRKTLIDTVTHMSGEGFPVSTDKSSVMKTYEDNNRMLGLQIPSIFYQDKPEDNLRHLKR
jgi:hypothetical protein